MHYDLVIVGGGINGAGIACDAAGRGLKVLLVEQDDLAEATSSASSKLIHGGLRYLEHYEFRLVRKALAEREILLQKAPHIIQPLRFILPHMPSLRSRWQIRAGLFLYDHLYRREAIPASRAIKLADNSAGKPLRQHLKHGFAYWDCRVDDARLVILNARAAADLGAEICTRTKAVSIQADAHDWQVSLRCQNASTRTVHARAVVNAAGPWVDDVLEASSIAKRKSNKPRLRLVKGSHIVVPRIAGAEDAYLLQNEDGRVIFVLPFEGQFSLIGTTEVTVEGDPGAVRISEEETDYLLNVVGRFFHEAPAAKDVAWNFAGVRPLLDDGDADLSQVTRDYALEHTLSPGGAPLITVLGGKITTYRQLAESALSMLANRFPNLGPSWTATQPLPGGEFPDGDVDAFAADLAVRLPALDATWLDQLVRRHGSTTEELLGDARDTADLGQHFGAGLFAREIDYLKRREWACTPDDILWRRTKTGLHMTPDERARAESAIAALL